MTKKSSKTEFREYLQVVLRTMPSNATETYYNAQVDAIIRMAEKIFSKDDKGEPISIDDIDEIYAAYPTRCVVQGRSLGKSSSDKEKIERLLRKKPKEEILFAIRRYVEECKRDKVYMKNFGTFLNNIPEYDLTEKRKTEDVNGYRDLRKITEAQ